MKAIGETKAIRIYPMKDSTYGIMWKIHPPEFCLEEFDKEDWAKNDEELIQKIKDIGEFILSKK
jgi:hypothetical protein